MEAALLRTFLTLAISVAAIGGLMFIVKKYGKKIRSQNSPIPLEIISKLSLSPKNQLYVIKAGGRTLLIGASEKSISAIADLSQTKDAKSNVQSNVKTTQTVKNKQVATKSQDLSFSAFLKSTLSSKHNN